MINRINCVICHEKLDTQIDLFSNMPLKMSCPTTNSYEADVFADQVYMICSLCGCIQLKNLIDPSILYDGKEYHAPGTVGVTWATHHLAFAEFVAKYSPRRIVEVGAGTTNLYNLIKHIQEITEYIIIDPNIEEESFGNLRIIRSMFDANFSQTLHDVDTIVHSHTMEHFYDVVVDIKRLTDQLSVGGKMIISVPLIDKLIESGHTNNLSWEHTYLITSKNLRYILESCGLKLLEMTTHTPFNTFICAEKIENIETPILHNEFKYTKELWTTYKEIIAKDIDTINQIIKSEPRPTFLFGAHMSTQVLFANGLDQNHFIALLDNSTLKQNKRLYGTQLFVLSPTVLEHINNARVIIRAGQYSKEIAEQLQNIAEVIL